MELRVLRYFLTVVQEQSITKAAETLHVTQPTLSRQLAQLEQEVGAQLFHRGARRITLTAEGLFLQRRAEEILELADSTERELLLKKEQTAGTVTVGCGELASVRVLAELFRGFRAMYPRVSFDLYTGAADLVKERMDKSLIDVGLLLEPVDMERYDFIRLRSREIWNVLMPAGAPLAAKQAVMAADLEGLPLILPHRGGVRSELASWFGEGFERQQTVATSNLWANILIMVESGLGYAVTTGDVQSLEGNPRVVSRPLSPELSATVVLAWRRQQAFGNAAQRFIAYIRECAAQNKCL